MTYLGRIQNGVAVLEKGAELPEGTSVLIQPAEPSEFWRGLSIDELAAQQHVVHPKTPAELVGDWPEQDSIEEFLQSLREGRR
ncbi:MAG TPA: hypothetical protein VIL86_20745 [Tepidisphaeraceae bacterium]|jgi:hypothetical protein